MTLEPPGGHVLVADIFRGGIYRVDVASGETELFYQHADSLYFANGIALDEQAGYLYVAETMGSRVLRFHMEVVSGTLSEPTVVLEIPFPDNIEFDPPARLWIAAVLRSEIVVFDVDSGVAQSVFRVATPRSEDLILEIEGRLLAGRSIFDLYGPDLWEPAPGSFTGFILSPEDGPVCVTSLGKALIRLQR